VFYHFKVLITVNVFSLPQNVQTSCGAHQVKHPGQLVPRILYTVVQRPEHKDDYSVSLEPRLTMTDAVRSFLYASIALCLINYTQNLTLTLLLLLSGIYNPYEFEPPHSGGSEITHKDAPHKDIHVCVCV
jgi:hypothetical protein